MQAAQSDWDTWTAPQSGWVDVTLPDNWSSRWPGYDGVVWYRLTWSSAAAENSGLFIDYLNMAGSIRVNDAELARDVSLVEPLSRMWNTPRYFLLTAPLLRDGENTLLLRISGLAAYEPGLGSVQVGAPAEMLAHYEHARRLRHDWQIVATAAIVTLGLFFLALWMFRRGEIAYGWYSVQQFAWLNIAWNELATSTWPFTNTDAFEAANTATALLFCACYTMFVLRFCGRRWPRRELTLWLAVAAGTLWLFLASHAAIGNVRALLMVLVTLYLLLPNGMLLYFAARNARTDMRILGLVGVMNVLIGAHDTLVFVGVIHSNNYYATMSALITSVGAALVLAWNFTRSLRRIEDFNRELQQNIDEARGELATTLQRQHDLELVHARLGERVSLAHDLHDGLGGMLIGNITALEQATESMPSRDVLDMLRELRDDLRLIIDTASAQHYGEHSLDQLLAPLRHRMTRLFEAHDIHVRWRIGELGDVYLSTTQSLDLLRILQEALANVLKHSGARRVDVDLQRGAHALQLEVRDDGVGIDAIANANFGTGMRSMQARARRLDATLSIGSQDGVTVVHLQMPLRATQVVAAAPA